jgi:glucosylceramidase
MGHFSKYVQRGAKRVATTKHNRNLYTCGFVNPDGSRICVVINTIDKNTLEYMKLIKRSFDPKNILNPGKIFNV